MTGNTVLIKFGQCHQIDDFDQFYLNVTLFKMKKRYILQLKKSLRKILKNYQKYQQMANIVYRIFSKPIFDPILLKKNANNVSGIFFFFKKKRLKQ